MVNHDSSHGRVQAGVIASVITVSDRSASGERQDESGPRAAQLLAEAGFQARPVAVVPDGIESVRNAIAEALASGARLVITSGGTGVSPRDLTPEATRPLIVRELPGIAELLRREGEKQSAMAVLGRGLAGIIGDPPNALVINLPGSVRAVEHGLAVVLPLVPHIIDQLGGVDH